MFKLEYNGIEVTTVDDIEYAKLAAAEPGKSSDGLMFFAPASPWEPETDHKGNSTGVLASGYWRIVPVK